MVFLDRDGTLIRDTGYLNSIDEIEFLDGVVDGLHRLLQNRWLPVVLTNQSGVARGYLDRDQLRAIHETLHNRLIDANAPVYGWFYCPHLPPDQLREREQDHCNPAYLTDCNCRKPSPGLWTEALEFLPDPLSMATSWSIGDRERDVDPARRLGGNGLLLAPENNTSRPDGKTNTPDSVSTFREAVRIILQRPDQTHHR